MNKFGWGVCGFFLNNVMVILFENPKDFKLWIGGILALGTCILISNIIFENKIKKENEEEIEEQEGDL